MMGVAVCCVILLTGALPILEANPTWPKVLWPAVLGAIGLTLSVLGLLGGWNWMRHFSFPVSFILVALPWPAVLMQPLTLGLMKFIAMLTAEVVSWLGQPAIAHGAL